MMNTILTALPANLFGEETAALSNMAWEMPLTIIGLAAVVGLVVWIKYRH